MGKISKFLLGLWNLAGKRPIILTVDFLYDHHPLETWMQLIGMGHRGSTRIKQATPATPRATGITINLWLNPTDVIAG